MTQRRRTKFEGDVPKCATPKQYRDWKLIARNFPPDRNVGFCENCTEKYKNLMVAIQRCENPDIIFTHDKNKNPLGTLPWILNKETEDECV